jgi:uncharacterized Fe-S cluster-containing radical SAM superfamily protein
VAEPRHYRGKDLAPYNRFQKRRFYGGCYTADIMYCNWTCEHCWSGFGWRTVPPKMELTSDQVVGKLLTGMRRHGLAFSRISGGEVSIYWRDHMRLVAGKFLEQTEGERIKVEGRRVKQPMRLVLETNGTAIGPPEVEAFEALYGDEAERVQLTIGVKATSAARLADLTGQTPATASRFRGKQLELVRFLSEPGRTIAWSALFLDAFSDEDELAAFIDELEAINPGITEGNRIDMQKFMTTSWGDKKYSERRYTPKRRAS